MDSQGCPVLYALVSVYRVRGAYREDLIARNLLLEDATALAATYSGRYMVEIRSHAAIPVIAGAVGTARELGSEDQARLDVVHGTVDSLNVRVYPGRS